MAAPVSSFASDDSFRAAFVDSFEATSEGSSEVASADIPEDGFVSTSEAGVSSGEAILAACGECRDPYSYPQRERKSLDGRARPFVPFHSGVGQRRERNEEEGGGTDTEEEEAGKAVVPGSGFGLEKERFAEHRDVRVQVPRFPSFAPEAELRNQGR